ncbi:MAG: site-2 protease family protein [Actinomycetota bacterium]|nr:site-2 protease family protein [Actinomycetota bacterium]
MTSSIDLGRIFGIRIGINWSWLIVFALIVWTLAAGIFPATNSGLSDGTYVAMAVAAAVLFFSSLLLHELGHAIEARREGMEIEGITLWLFGGVAKFRGMFPSAGAEFRIAIAGPLVSLALGVLFSLGAWFVSASDAVDGVAAWLGYINLTLLVFNMLPALPLDGGRVLRSTLWHLRGDFRNATRVAARVGRAFGYTFIAAGIFLFIFQGSFSGAWLAFIGWFLLQAATAEDRYAMVSETLGGVRVGDLMIREPVTVAPEMSIGRFMDEVAWNRRYTTYPVVEDGRVVGLLAFRCVAEVPRSDWDARKVADCMIPTERVPVLDEHDTAANALAELSQAEVNRGVVLDGGRLAGFISITDLARALEIGMPRRRRIRGAA